jgi:putative oxidoreductase
MKNKLFSSQPIFLDTGLAIIRIIVGLFMVYHGWEVFDKAKMNEYAAWDNFKNLPSASAMVYLGKTAELVSGLLLSIGWFTRPAALIMACTMLYISFFVGHGKVWYDDQHPFLFVLLALVFFFTGPGRWSVDHIVSPEKNNTQ